MPDPITNTPESPPAGPVIPIGLATRVGQIVGAAFGLIALITAVLDGDHSQETITALILSAITFVTLMGGRYAQAAAAELAKPSVDDDDDDIGPDDLEGLTVDDPSSLPADEVDKAGINGDGFDPADKRGDES